MSAWTRIAFRRHDDSTGRWHECSSAPFSIEEAHYLASNEQRAGFVAQQRTEDRTFLVYQPRKVRR